MSTSTTPSEGDMRVWYIPQIPGKAFTVSVSDFEMGTQLLQNVIYPLSLFEFENYIKPDYADAGGIQRWESDGEGGFDWYEYEESDFEPENYEL